MTRTFLATVAAALLASGCSLRIDPEQYAPKRAGDCAVGEKPCGYRCVPVNDPETGCGAAECAPCPGGANAVAACASDGQCSLDCNPGWDDCDLAPGDGCETQVTDSANCGACGRACGSTSCVVPGWVCAPDATVPVGGVTTGLEFNSVSQMPYALVQTTSGGVLARGTTVGTFDVVATGLGYVSGLAIVGDEAWFGRSVGNSEVGYFTTLSPSPSALQTRDAVAVTAGPPVDLVATLQGALWIPQDGAPVRFLPATNAVGDIVLSGARFTALEADRIYHRFYAADDSAGGTIWETYPPPAFGSWTPIVTGAGSVGSMAAWNMTGSLTLYWTELSRGDVYRYQQSDNRKERIHAGTGPTAAMDIAIDGAGDPYWTNRSTGEVMTWKAYGTYPRAVHVIGRSPAPGRIALSPMPMVYWADDVDQAIRAVRP